VDAVHSFNPGLPLLLLPGAVAGKKAAARGLTSLSEAFADRAYNPDGTLVSRREEGAVLHDHNAITDNMVRLATEGTIIARDGSLLQVQADSICVHGDTPGAVAMAGAVRAGLEDAGVTVRSFV
jgi:UPF0271 protein